VRAEARPPMVVWFKKARPRPRWAQTGLGMNLMFCCFNIDIWMIRARPDDKEIGNGYGGFSFTGGGRPVGGGRW
jgi:hypothetical protein